MTWLWEALITHLAFKRLLTGVHAHACFKVRRCIEKLVTDFALMFHWWLSPDAIRAFLANTCVIHHMNRCDCWMRHTRILSTVICLICFTAADILLFCSCNSYDIRDLIKHGQNICKKAITYHVKKNSPAHYQKYSNIYKSSEWYP